MKILKPIGLLITSSALWISSAAQSQEQLVSLVYEGGNKISINYSTTDSKKTTGVGFRLHFDSSKVGIKDITLALEESNLGVQLMADDEDVDGNPATDFYVNAAWVDLSGFWPESDSMPVNLYQLDYDALVSSAIDLFTVTSTSTAVGYEFNWGVELGK